ncbi:hypothetical protein BWI15_01355 [Kribbella sp. ALI-6-A]|uniref:hypothetical protein n=1 Tax=Kribbella sp. ALI-6-A TaxID=1933817 RepID=UPI0009D1659E|nr:hypothetical protein [Kribbella sp. ALI-6-A]ONI78544.1 hypothetical protein BWI15_01355 [Kribbella sp. ALI-6-A]
MAVPEPVPLSAFDPVLGQGHRLAAQVRRGDVIQAALEVLSVGQEGALNFEDFDTSAVLQLLDAIAAAAADGATRCRPTGQVRELRPPNWSGALCRTPEPAP